ncbi:MFS transporter, partial [Lichenihabitans sp. Uapishka_5]|nr:MFS transporter [Lichenihabitans sp. Uapishka_5]
LGPGMRPEAHEAGLAWPARAAWGLCAIAFCCLMLEGAVADWSAIYLAGEAHLSDAMAAGGYAGFSVAMLTGRFAGDGVVRRFGRRRIVIGGSLMAFVGLGLSVALPDGPAGIGGFLLVGLGLSNVVPVVFSAAARTGRTAAAGIAAVASCGYGGFIGGPPVIGAIAGATTLRTALGCLLVVALVSLLAGLRTRWVDA